MEDSEMFEVSTSGNASCANGENDNLSPIAKPLAPSKLSKKICKLIKASLEADRKLYIDIGIKNVQRSLRNNHKGIVIFAGDITPVEVMCHLPAVCEEANIPYVYVRDRQLIGSALGKNYGCLMVLIKKNDTTAALYDEVVQKINALPPPW